MPFDCVLNMQNVTAADKSLKNVHPLTRALFWQEVVWSDFGYPGRDGAASTLWVGTEGANTPCHLDTYGYNLVFQVQGR